MTNDTPQTSELDNRPAKGTRLKKPRLARAGYCMPDPAAALTDKEIMKHVPVGSRVLDLGCGDGRLLEILRDVHQCRVQGIELDPQEFVGCIDRGVPVIRGDLDHGLPEFPDDSFDYAVLSQTLQQLKYPKRGSRGDSPGRPAGAGGSAQFRLLERPAPTPAGGPCAGDAGVALRVVQHAEFALHVDVRLPRPGRAAWAFASSRNCLSSGDTRSIGPGPPTCGPKVALYVLERPESRAANRS